MVDVHPILPSSLAFPELRRHVPATFLDFKETMFFYYGNRYTKYSFDVDDKPIHIPMHTRDKTGQYMLVSMLKYLIPFIKDGVKIVLYHEHNIEDYDIPHPIITIHASHLRSV